MCAVVKTEKQSRRLVVGELQVFTFSVEYLSLILHFLISSSFYNIPHKCQCKLETNKPN